MKAAVIGGGLAGVECAKALSENGIEVERSYNPRLKYIEAIDKRYF